MQKQWNGTFQEDLIALLQDHEVSTYTVELVKDFFALRSKTLNTEAFFHNSPAIMQNFEMAELHQRKIGCREIASLLEDVIKRERTDSWDIITIRYSIGLLVDFT